MQDLGNLGLKYLNKYSDHVVYDHINAQNIENKLKL